MKVCVVAATVMLALMPRAALASAPDAPDEVAPATPKTSPGRVQFTANATLLSDYRFRGTSYSLGKAVAQASLVASHDSGLFAGVYASSLSHHPVDGAVEVDLFAGYAKAVTPTITAEATLYYYYYPDANPAFPHTNAFETTLQLTGDFGAFMPKLGIWYAWDQATLGDRDNVYLFGDLGWRVPKTVFDAKLHAGYTHGAYSIAASHKTVDWSAGVGFWPVHNIRFGLDYVGISRPKIKNFSDDTVVASLSFDF